MSNTETLIEAKFLNVCPPFEAVNWLKEKRKALARVDALLTDTQQLQELVLVTREDPYIDFGLARYGLNVRVGAQVYARGDKGIRIAYLAHFPNGGFHWMGDRFSLASDPPKDLDELCALATNPSLSDSMFEELFARKKIFAALDEEQFITLLIAVADNKRLSTPYDDRTLDGYSDYSYHKVFSAAWELAGTVPNTLPWASTLQHLLHRCNLPQSFDPLPILDRWRLASADKSGDPRGTAFYLRARLADTLQSDDALLNAADPALRYSFYNRFNPARYPMWPGFIKDGEIFLEAALRNKFLWQKVEYRAALRQICWAFPDPESRLEQPSSYNWADDYFRKSNPEWFRDED